jgi:hypothetical protein
MSDKKHSGHFLSIFDQDFLVGTGSQIHYNGAKLYPSSALEPCSVFWEWAATAF